MVRGSRGRACARGARKQGEVEEKKKGGGAQIAWEFQKVSRKTKKFIFGAGEGRGQI